MKRAARGINRLLRLVASALALQVLAFPVLAGTVSPADYPVVAAATAGLSFHALSSRQDGAGLVVSGRLRRSHRPPLPGQLELAVCAADGSLVGRQRQRLSALASHRGGMQEVPFRWRLALLPPAGARLVVRYLAPASPAPDSPCPVP